MQKRGLSHTRRVQGYIRGSFFWFWGYFSAGSTPRAECILVRGLCSCPKVLPTLFVREVMHVFILLLPFFVIIWAGRHESECDCVHLVSHREISVHVHKLAVAPQSLAQTNNCTAKIVLELYVRLHLINVQHADGALVNACHYYKRQAAEVRWKLSLGHPRNVAHKHGKSHIMWERSV